MKTKDLILIIEDDEAISRMLSLFLDQQGYKIIVAGDMKSAIRELQTQSPEIVLLDLGLPGGDGKTLIKSIRTQRSTPIIVLSARHEEKEIIASLELGADDYMTKPFSTYELLARIRSAQRRFMGLQPSSNILQCHELVMDTAQHTVVKNGEFLKLTPTEFSLLKYFMLHRNQVLTHIRLLKEVWGVGYQQEMQYLRTYVNSLRKKIEHDSTRPAYILTELGVGYRFGCGDDFDSKE